MVRARMKIGSSSNVIRTFTKISCSINKPMVSQNDSFDDGCKSGGEGWGVIRL